MTIERQIFEQPKRHRISKAERFRTQIADLEPAPAGMEYKRFHGQLVLFPETGNDQIREGTGYTERQLQVAIRLQNERNVITSIKVELKNLEERRLGINY